MIKIYSDDPNLPYKTTHLSAIYSKSEIDGIFAKHGVKKVMWNYDPENIDVYVQFKLSENIEGLPINASFKIEAPIIWNHNTRNKTEEVNWNISMRVMFWFIKSLLEMSYLRQSSKISAFLPFIMTGHERTLEMDLAHRLRDLAQLPAPKETNHERDSEKVIDVEVVEPEKKEE